MMNIGLVIFDWSSFILLLERVLATVFRQKYEGGYRIVTPFLIAIHIFLATVVLKLFYWNFEYDEHRAFCQAGNKNKLTASAIAHFTIIVTLLITKTGFVKLRHKNENLRREETESSLSNRYQLEENIRSIELMELFSTYDFFFCFFYGTTTIVVFLFSHLMSYPVYIAFVEGLIILPFYSIVVPVAMFKKLQRKSEKRARNLNKVMHMSHDHYFKDVADMWK